MGEFQRLQTGGGELLLGLNEEGFSVHHSRSRSRRSRNSPNRTTTTTTAMTASMTMAVDDDAAIPYQGSALFGRVSRGGRLGLRMFALRHGFHSAQTVQSSQNRSRGAAISAWHIQTKFWQTPTRRFPTVLLSHCHRVGNSCPFVPSLGSWRAASLRGQFSLGWTVCLPPRPRRRHQTSNCFHIADREVEKRMVN